MLNVPSEGSAKVASMMCGSRIIAEETIAQSLQGGTMERMARVASGWHILETSGSIKAHNARCNVMRLFERLLLSLESKIGTTHGCLSNRGFG